MAREKSKPVSRPAGGGEARTDKEEIAFLRQKFNSLMMRGHYRECFKAIEDNLRVIYTKDRWPDTVLACLRMHKRCYPSMDISQPYGEYLSALLRKNNIPEVYVQLLAMPEKEVTWTTDKLRELALEAKNRGEFQQALGYCDLLLKMDPLSSNCYLMKGWMLTELGEHDRAAEIYRTAIERNETNYQAWNSLAEYYKDRDPKEALSCVEKAIKMAPSEAKYQATKGAILFKMGDRTAALESYHQAVLLDPQNPEFHYQQGEILLLDSQTLSAMRYFNQALSVNEHHLPSLRRMAELSAQTQPERALGYLASICNLEPDNLQAAVQRADLTRKTGQSQLAARQYHRIIDQDPSCVHAHGALGDIYRIDEPERAVLFYNQAIELDKNNALYRVGKARAMEALNRREEALEEYKAALALDKRSAEAWGAWGTMLLEEDPEQAAQYLAKAVALQPDNPDYHRARGEALLKLPKRSAEAVKEYQAALQYDPGNALLHQRLAYLLEADDKDASAMEHYKQAVSLDPGDAASWAGLARLTRLYYPHLAYGQVSKAIELDATNGEYYYLKGLVLQTLSQSAQGLELLREEGPASGKEEALKEFMDIRNGEGLRVALLYLNRAIELVKENTIFLCTRADFLSQLGSPAKALEQYQQAMELDPQCHQAYYGIGRILADKQEVKKALEAFDKAVNLAPAESEYLAARADLLSEDDDRYQEALESYNAALAIAPKDWSIQLRKAKLLDRHGDLLQAQALYRRVLFEHADCLDAIARMGELLAERGIMSGLGYLERAMQLDPENPVYHVWKARLLFLRGRNDEAEEACRAAIVLGAGGEEIYVALAESFRKKAPKRALYYLDQAVELAGERANLSVMRGDIYLRLKDLERAKAAYNRAMELDPNNHEAMAKCSRVMLWRKEDGYLELIERAIELDEKNGRYHFYKAQILAADEDRLDEALEFAANAVKLEPERLKFREFYVELLTQKRARIRLFVERRALEKCRKRWQELEQALEGMDEFSTPEPEDVEEMPEPLPTEEEEGTEPAALQEGQPDTTEQEAEPEALELENQPEAEKPAEQF